jgi:hypothetical protein
MKPNIKLIKILLSSLLLGATIFLTIQVIIQAKKNQIRKIDLSEINHIRYGLLNVDEWSEKVAVVMTEKINEFELTPENREQLQTSVENILYRLIDEVEILMEERTSGSFSGIKKWVAGFAIDVEQMRDSVPSFADNVLLELNKPETKNALKSYVLDKLNEFVETTFNKDKMVFLNELLRIYGCENKSECQEYLHALIDSKEDKINYMVIIILVIVLLIFLLNLYPKGPLTRFQVPVLIGSSLCMLLAGIITPMIELEARIDLLLFQLIGEEIVFKEQIFFFQSKSITDVVHILITDGSVQMIFVGILIFTFSVLFPSMKLISSYIYYINPKNLRENRLIKFFVLKSGKWSMADVIVVAIFMAYIGFNGIVSSQLTNLSNKAEPVEILTTNGTHLVGGFYLFLFFCLSSLWLSEVLVRRTKLST